MGLSSNSISIYSDGINNLFDSLTGILSFFAVYYISRQRDMLTAFSLSRIQQLLSFIIGVAVSFTAFYFLYNCLERLTYPAPVVYTDRYFILIGATAAVKLILFFSLRVGGKSGDSSVIRLMSLDSLLDFFITCVTLLTLYLSGRGGYSLDALCGIAISIIILITAVKGLTASLRELLGTVRGEDRELLVRLLSSVEEPEIRIIFTGGKKEAYIKVSRPPEEADLLREEIKNQTGIEAYFITC